MTNRFREVMTEEEEYFWLNHLDYNPLGKAAEPSTDDYVANEEKYFQKFLKQDFANGILLITRNYLEKCMPKPLETQNIFWAVTLNPSFEANKYNRKVILAINMAQVVFYIEADAEGQVYFVFQLLDAEITNDKSFISLLNSSDLEIKESNLVVGGSPQKTLITTRLEIVTALFEDESFVLAQRRFNLGLVERRGKQVEGRAKKNLTNHSYHLMNHLFLQSDYQEMLLEEDESVYIEGQLRQVSRLERVRNRKLVEDAKQNFIRKHGRLYCEVCGFDFEKQYGELGKDFIEAHHIKPISALETESQISSFDNLLMVCSNCHRMLHRQSPPYSLEDLKKHIHG